MEEMRFSLIESTFFSIFHMYRFSFRATDESPEAPEEKKKGYYLMDLGRYNYALCISLFVARIFSLAHKC